MLDALYSEGASSLDRCFKHLFTHLTAHHFTLIPALLTKLRLCLADSPPLFTPLLLRLHFANIVSSTQLSNRLAPFLSLLLVHPDTLRAEQRILLALSESSGIDEQTQEADGESAEEMHEQGEGESQEESLCGIWRSGDLWEQYGRLSDTEKRAAIVELAECLRHGLKR